MGFAEDTAEKLINLLQEGSTITVESLVSGTGVQLSPNYGAYLYLQTAAGTAGTVEVALSADGVTYHDVFPATAADAVAQNNITVRVPAAWYVKVTTAVSAISGAVAHID
jgi:hypothetical protein